jgi:hypothetical protein
MLVLWTTRSGFGGGFGLSDLGFHDRQWRGEVILHHRKLNLLFGWGVRLVRRDNFKLLGQLLLPSSCSSHIRH